MAAIRNKKTSTFLLILFVIGAHVNGLNPYSSHSMLVKASTLQSLNPVEQLQQELFRYTEIEKRGGWPTIQLRKKQYKKGDVAPEIRQLKNRLWISGDLPVKDTSSLFTGDLEKAVKKIQRQFGFDESGIVDKELVKELSIPVQKRRAQLQINLERVRALANAPQGRRIIVNIPEYKLHVYEGSSHVFDMKVVVGSRKNKTAVFEDELTQIVFSPYWNVPRSIVEDEILPAMKRRRNYLSANGYEIVRYENGLPVIRQRPGRRNSLGLVKFLFPNQHAIYFHDTPVKSLFSRRVRAYSHGCIRLSEPQKMAAYLLKDMPEWTPEKIVKAMHAGREQWVKLASPIPVSIIYLTAWIDHEGLLHFRDDIYGNDKQMPVAGIRRIGNSAITAGVLY